MKFIKKYLKSGLLFIPILFISHCPIIEKLYSLQTGTSDILSRKEAQKIVKDSVAIFMSRCTTPEDKATIYLTFESMLEARPCNAGILSIKGRTIVYCYQKIFLDRSDIQSCSLILLASTCGESKLAELAVSSGVCESSLRLERYNPIFSIF